jgi:hypothetical protein
LCRVSRLGVDIDHFVLQLFYPSKPQSGLIALALSEVKSLAPLLPIGTIDRSAKRL